MAMTPAFVCSSCLKRQAQTHRKQHLLGLSSAAVAAASRSGSSRTFREQRRNQSRTAHLSNRRLIALHGPDAPEFLHGITTNTIPYSENARTSGRNSNEGVYSGFLNAQGRIVHDVFIYPAAHSQVYRDLLPDYITRKYGADDPAFFVEVDSQGLDSLAKHLKRYKLRAKVDLRKIEEGEYNVLASWTPGQDQSSAIPIDLGCADPRAPGMGTRYLASSAATPTPTAALEEYTRHRHSHGVPEGQSTHEIPSEHALPHEYNMDLMHGIDFRKGCYVGQELTIRTQHKGVVRKRILPVALYDAAAGETPPSSLADIPSDRGAPLLARLAGWAGTDIVPRGRRGRPAGRWVAGAPGVPGDVGLAMCRVEMMTDLVVSTEGGSMRWREGDEFVLRRKAGRSDGDDGAEGDAPLQTAASTDDGGGEAGEIGIKAFVPDWIRSGIRVR